MNEEINFLKELQEEMNTQENDGQAAPRFWTIMDYQWKTTDEGNHERVSLFDIDSCETMTIEEYVKAILSGESNLDLTEEDMEELKDNYEHFPSEIEDWIEEHDSKNYHFLYEKEESFIAMNTLFFTKNEAKQHVENNRHHYSSKAHTFAMTVNRAPKMEKLMKILTTFDWDSVEEKESTRN